MIRCFDIWNFAVEILIFERRGNGVWTHVVERCMFGHAISFSLFVMAQTSGCHQTDHDSGWLKTSWDVHRLNCGCSLFSRCSSFPL